jgi:hypothetical protein
MALVAIEVKSGASRAAPSGMEAFAQAFKPKRLLRAGGQGIPLDEFFAKPAASWL